jgi:hypothetical protein
VRASFDHGAAAVAPSQDLTFGLRTGPGVSPRPSTAGSTGDATQTHRDPEAEPGCQVRAGSASGSYWSR